MSKWRYAAFALEQVLRNVLWSSSSWPRRMVTAAHRYTVRMASSHILGRSNQIPKFHLQSHLLFFQMFVWLIWRLPGDHGFDQQLLPLCLSFRPHEPREPAGLVRPDLAWPHWQVSQHLGETNEEPYTIQSYTYIYMYLIYTYKFMFISSFETRWENGVMQGGLMEFDVRIHLYIYIHVIIDKNIWFMTAKSVCMMTGKKI